MPYSPEAVARRRCTGTRKDGAACRAWATWDHPRQLCMAHAGRHHRGPIPPRRGSEPEKQTMYAPCRCQAYDWPHRPGGGLCRWPEPPIWRCPTPAGTHDWPRIRRPKRWSRLKAIQAKVRSTPRALPLFGRLDRLAVDARGAGVRIPPDGPPHLGAQLVVEPLQGPVVAPAAESTPSRCPTGVGRAAGGTRGSPRSSSQVHRRV